MQVRVKFFAAARDDVGSDHADLALPDGSSVTDAREAIVRRFPALRDRLSRCRIAVDEEFAEPGETLREGAELAVIPPVSGG
jgi:molybdopterin converting factor subunit 1